MPGFECRNGYLIRRVKQKSYPQSFTNVHSNTKLNTVDSESVPESDFVVSRSTISSSKAGSTSEASSTSEAGVFLFFISGITSGIRHISFKCTRLYGSHFSFLVCLFAIAQLAVLFSSSSAQAQSKARQRLFSGAAVLRANQAFGRAPSKVSVAEGLFGGGLGLDTGSDIDSLSDAFLRRERRPEWSGDYGLAVYSAHTREQVSLPDKSDEIMQSVIAQRIFYDQMARGIARSIVGSGLEPLYRDMEKAARWVGDKTTFRIDRGDRSALKVKSSERSTEKTAPLAELKFQVNTNSIIEPRICIGSNTLMRYDHIHGEGFVEYYFPF